MRRLTDPFFLSSIFPHPTLRRCSSLSSLSLSMRQVIALLLAFLLCLGFCVDFLEPGKKRNYFEPREMRERISWSAKDGRTVAAASSWIGGGAGRVGLSLLPFLFSLHSPYARNLNREGKEKEREEDETGKKGGGRER